MHSPLLLHGPFARELGHSPWQPGPTCPMSQTHFPSLLHLPLPEQISPFLFVGHCFEQSSLPKPLMHVHTGLSATCCVFDTFPVFDPFVAFPVFDPFVAFCDSSCITRSLTNE